MKSSRLPNVHACCGSPRRDVSATCKARATADTRWCCSRAARAKTHRCNITHTRSLFPARPAALTLCAAYGQRARRAHGAVLLAWACAVGGRACCLPARSCCSLLTPRSRARAQLRRAVRRGGGGGTGLAGLRRLHGLAVRAARRWWHEPRARRGGRGPAGAPALPRAQGAHAQDTHRQRRSVVRELPALRFVRCIARRVPRRRRSRISTPPPFRAAPSWTRCGTRCCCAPCSTRPCARS
jgi:hypothetical protein